MARPEHVDERTLERHREQLQRLVMDLGRDDMGVGDVRAMGDTLHFTLTSGSHVQVGEISLHVLDNPEAAKDALTAILIPVSKAIEKEHLKAVHGGSSD
jgi:hypothetical protein